jgi:hypothetical protein
MDGAGTMVVVVLAQWKFKILWPSLALVAVLLLGAAIIALVDRWRKRGTSDKLSAGDQLSHFRRLYDEGTISKEEFEQIRAELAGRLRDELNVRPADTSATGGPAPPAGAIRAPEMTLPEDGNGKLEPPSDGIRPA